MLKCSTTDRTSVKTCTFRGLSIAMFDCRRVDRFDMIQPLEKLHITPCAAWAEGVRKTAHPNGRFVRGGLNCCQGLGESTLIEKDGD
jgi:hypothetical protein